MASFHLKAFPGSDESFSQGNGKKSGGVSFFLGALWVFKPSAFYYESPNHHVIDISVRLFRCIARRSG